MLNSYKKNKIILNTGYQIKEQKEDKREAGDFPLNTTLKSLRGFHLGTLSVHLDIPKTRN